ncbi:MAG TPA: PaaI family thioesterase [Anaerolineae bacterium]|nr:PaaI family thioesterase [Anaerolineae bacterium]
MSMPFEHVNQHNAQKQYNSRMCFVCGVENPAGLHAHFYQIDDRTCVARFLPADHHQGYPGRVHGGVIAAIMDETMGRAVWGDAQTWGVTAELTLKYKLPVPLDEMLTVVGRLTRDTRRVFEAEGELLTADGRVAVVAKGKYIKIPLERILEETAAAGLNPGLELFIVPDPELNSSNKEHG